MKSLIKMELYENGAKQIQISNSNKFWFLVSFIFIHFISFILFIKIQRGSPSAVTDFQGDSHFTSS